MTIEHRVFVTAKDVIRGLLKTDPDERFTIREVVHSKWVSVCPSFGSRASQ